MEELIIYALVLGVVATFFVPVVWTLAGKVVPASLSQNAMIPATYPKTGAAILWSVLFWGVLLAAGIWLASQLGPVGRAVKESA